jgi:hypothetical protein
MSFNYKPKIVIQNINLEVLYKNYERYLKDPNYQRFLKPFSEENTFCNSCNENLDKTSVIYGIPVSIKENCDKLNVEMCGSYCSFLCSYKHFISMEAESSKRKNIKFADSGPLFKFLFYRIFKDYDIEKHTEKIYLEDYNIEIIHSSPNIIS